MLPPKFQVFRRSSSRKAQIPFAAIEYKVKVSYILNLIIYIVSTTIGRYQLKCTDGTFFFIWSIKSHRGFLL